MITVALAKGALLKDSVARFAAAGLDFSAVLDKNNRQLMVPTPCGRARALLVRNGKGWAPSTGGCSCPEQRKNQDQPPQSGLPSL